MLGLSILNLLPNGGHIVEGSIKLEGNELVGLRDKAMQKIRGNEIAMIFQDSQSSLNPTKTIGTQVAEPVRLHRGASSARRASARSRCSSWSACRSRSSASTTIPTSSPAACASA
jgi:ABC-type dipeptide/oligopeptide/nickel transport system ATPase component